MTNPIDIVNRESGETRRQRRAAHLAKLEQDRKDLRAKVTALVSIIEDLCDPVGGYVPLDDPRKCDLELFAEIRAAIDAAGEK